MVNINSLNIFQPGEKALSADVNENFESLRINHNEHEGRISGLETNIQTKAPKIGDTTQTFLVANGISSKCAVNKEQLDLHTTSPVHYRNAARQAVLAASLDPNGVPNYLSAGSGLSVNISASATVPVILSFAKNYDMNGYVDFVAQITSNQTISFLTANTVNYLYFTRLYSNGAIYYNKTTIAPAYGFADSGRPTSPVTNQFYFDFSRMKWYKYSGTAWNEELDTNLFYAEATTDANIVTSIVTYSMLGKARIVTNALAATQNQIFNHNIGFNPKVINLSLVCLATDGNYAVGDRVRQYGFYNISTEKEFFVVVDKNTIKTVTKTAISLPDKSTGTLYDITLSKWAFEICLERGF